MVYSFCLDENNSIISICSDDLSGCSDWYRGEIPLTPNDDLIDIHGAALYKYVNGEVVERSEEERKTDWHDISNEDEATAEDYLNALKRFGVAL